MNYIVTLFFVPWENPEDIIEFTTERECLEDIDVYGISMVEAAEIVKADLPLDTTFHMLRSVKHGEESLELDVVTLSTGSSVNEPIVLETLQGVRKAMEVISKVADTLQGLQ